MAALFVESGSPWENGPLQGLSEIASKVAQYLGRPSRERKRFRQVARIGGTVNLATRRMNTGRAGKEKK